MTANDKRAFASMMKTMHELYRKQEPSKELMQVWFAKLSQFDCQLVSWAFDRWVDSQQHMATPADIIQLCKAELDRRELKQVTIQSRPNSLLAYQANKKNAEELKQRIEHMTQPSGDMRLWAKRILARIDRGEKVETIAAKFAREAMNVSAE